MGSCGCGPGRHHAWARWIAVDAQEGQGASNEDPPTPTTPPIPFTTVKAPRGWPGLEAGPMPPPHVLARSGPSRAPTVGARLGPRA
jgi:hypothetical protein